METDWKQVNIRVTDTDKQTIKRLAEKRNMTHAEAIMEAVEQRYRDVTLQPLIDATLQLYGELRLSTAGLELEYMHQCETVLKDIETQAGKRNLPLIQKKAQELLDEIDERLEVQSI